MITTKQSAFLVHLAASGVIFILLSALIYFSLYPGVLFTTDGGVQGIKIIAGIDLVIGPLLTLIIFNPKKEKLKQDLTIILTLQIGLLIAGMYLVYHSRPIAVIFSDGKYHTMSKDSFAMHQLDYRTIATHPFQPTYYIIPRPRDEELASLETRSQLIDGPIYLKTNRYQPYATNWKKVENDLLPVEKIESFNLDNRTLEKYWILPFEGRYYQDYVLVNKQNGEVSRTLPQQ